MTDNLHRAAEEHFNRGNDLDENGHRDAAIKAWQEAVELDPEHAAAHFNLGIAFADEGEPARALHHLREAVRLDPFDVEARRELAEVYLEQDRFDDAINQLRQALNLAPSDGETAHLLAEVYLENEMWDAAAGALEAGAMLEEDADLWFQLGRGYEHANRQDDAILAYRRALVCFPEHRESADQLRMLHVPVEEPPDPDEDS
ncbi:MAG: tetratricopeptide repeat protein [Chloroflexi bacterium]|nr:tetratricopeptide repeat protein [Chloroflexota bacterium]